MLDLIERKAAGQEIVAEPMVEPPAKVLDLVAALEASLEKAQHAKERHPSVAAASAAKKPAAKATKAATKKAAAKKAPAKAHGQEAQRVASYDARRFGARVVRAGRQRAHLGDAVVVLGFQPAATRAHRRSVARAPRTRRRPRTSR